jgi:hypothetical protein
MFPPISERKLGTLKVKRRPKIDIEDALSLEPLEDVTRKVQRVLPAISPTIAKTAGSRKSGENSNLPMNDPDAISLDSYESHQSFRRMVMDMMEATLDRDDPERRVNSAALLLAEEKKQ